MFEKDDSQPQYLSTEEIANRLRISERTVIRWVKTGELCAFRLGHITRVTLEDYKKFLEKHSKERSK